MAVRRDNMTLREILNKIDKLVANYGERLLDTDVFTISDSMRSCYILGNPYVSILEDGAYLVMIPDENDIDEDGD